MKKKILITLLSLVCASACLFALAACSENKVHVTSVTLDNSELTLGTGDEAKLTATVLPDNATDKTVVWTVDDRSIAQVSNDGLVTAFSQGVAVVTATADSVSATCTVTVTQKIPVELIGIMDSEVVLFGNSEKTLNFSVVPSDTTSSLTWSVEPQGIVEVDNGKLTALSQGVATVTASADGVSNTCKVTVSEDGLQYVLQTNGLSYYVESNYAAEGLIDAEDIADVEVASEFNGKPVSEIGRYAFMSANLTSLKIPASVTKIHTASFFYNPSLESIEVDKNNANFAGVDGILYNKSVTECLCVPKGKKGEVTIPETMTEISEEMFYERDNLTGVKMHDGITAIGAYAFYNCINLNSIVITENITEIGNSAFSGCRNLWEIYNLSDLRIDIGDLDANGCIGGYALNIIYMKNFPSGIDKRSDGYTFYTARENKAYLVEYTGDETQIVLPSDYNGNKYEINKYAFYRNTKLTGITVSDGVTAIGESAFSNCENLVNVTISGGVESIGKNAFVSCDNLTSVVLCEGITKITEFMFEHCDNLKKVTIPNTVTNIMAGSFWDCKSLTEIDFDGTKEQWNAIDKFQNWDLRAGNYTVHCTDGDIVKS